MSYSRYHSSYLSSLCLARASFFDFSSRWKRLDRCVLDEMCVRRCETSENLGSLAQSEHNNGMAVGSGLDSSVGAREAMTLLRSQICSREHKGLESMHRESNEALRDRRVTAQSLNDGIQLVTAVMAERLRDGHKT
jgi:hypothetical protein